MNKKPCINCGIREGTAFVAVYPKDGETYQAAKMERGCYYLAQEKNADGSFKWMTDEDLCGYRVPCFKENKWVYIATLQNTAEFYRKIEEIKKLRKWLHVSIDKITLILQEDIPGYLIKQTAMLRVCANCEDLPLDYKFYVNKLNDYPSIQPLQKYDVSAFIDSIIKTALDKACMV